MSHVVEYHRFVLYEIPSLKGKRVLELGAGRGIWAYLMRSAREDFDSIIVGVDIHSPYLAHCKRFRVYDDLVRADARWLPFVESVFDIVVAAEVIEHLPKAQGPFLLKEIERVCQGKAVITTPNGFWHQREIPHGVASETHLSGWSVSDLVSFGYKVHGIGFRPARQIMDRQPKLWGFLHYTFTPFSQVFPRLGELLIATKELGNTHPIQVSPIARQYFASDKKSKHHMSLDIIHASTIAENNLVNSV